MCCGKKSCQNSKDTILSIGDRHYMNECLSKIFVVTDLVSVNEIKKKVDFLVDSIQEHLERYTENSFIDTFGRFNDFYSTLFSLKGSLNAYLLIGGDDEVKAAIQVIFQELTVSYIEKISMNVAIYNTFKKVYEHCLRENSLTNLEKKYATDLIEDFEENGIHFEAEKKKIFQDLQKEAIEVDMQFEHNIRNDSGYIYADEEEITGITEEQKKILSKESGRYKLGVDYATFNLIMDCCSNREIRKKLYDKFMNRAYPKNNEILERVRVVHDKIAKILGRESFASLCFKDEMAKDPLTVSLFIEGIANHTKERAHAEIEEIRSFAHNEMKISVVESYDVAYLMNSYKKEKFGYDEAALTNYFPLSHLLKKFLHLIGEFLGVTFKIFFNGELDEWKWDSHIIVIEVSKNNELLGYIICDMYPRDKKYTHGCMSPITNSYRMKNGRLTDPSVILLVMNFNPPVYNGESLLSHDNVFTFFHEMGHALHGIIGVVGIASLSGVNVANDFVEIPSQLFQLFSFDTIVIKEIGKHYLDGSSIPDTMLHAFKESREFGRYVYMQKYVEKSRFSLMLFTTDLSIDKVKEASRKGLISIAEKRYENDHFEAAFGHLVEYYAAYYSYGWSVAYSNAIFEKIASNGGIFSKEIGKKYVESILSKGKSQEYGEMIENFLESSVLSPEEIAKYAIF